MALDYQTDRRVRFLGDSEYKSLYKWYLQEFDDAGKKIGSPQVPWNWSLNFTATGVTLHETLKLEHDAPIIKKMDPPVVERLEDWKIKIEDRSYISATLRPGYHANDDDDVVYSMFGTGRTIKEFQLTIHSLEKEEDDEKALAWGSVSYEYEGADMLNELSDDTVQFYLHVKPSRFAHYIEMMRTHPVNVLSLRLSTVLGMYSEWSPTTRTSRVKVLANAEDQKVEMAADAEFKPRELGWIGTFEVTFSSVREMLKRPQHIVEDQTEELEAITAGESMTDDAALTQRALLQLAVQQRDRSKQLLYAAWAVVALLIVLVFRQ
jgi:hypothetical protein